LLNQKTQKIYLMKNFKLITSIGLALTLVFASCSLEKRHYNKGYAIDWNSKAPKTTEQAAKKTAPVSIENPQSFITVKSVENNRKTETAASPELTASTTQTATATAKHVKTTTTSIENPVKVQTTKADVKLNTAIGAKIAKKVTDAADGGKSQIIALVLCCLGFIVIAGIHRIYLGYIGIGILQLLTAGGCGIWTIIDLIRIVSGDLGPRDGSGYSETL
jgi:hypothetical protein